jgi:prophage regulatory protein
MQPAILRLADVKHCVRLSKSQIYALVARGDFPPPFKLSARASGWDAEAVASWVAERMRASRKEAA